MRLKEKKDILNLLNTIAEGLEYATNKKDTEVNSMLEDCTGAIEYIGSKLGNELNKSINSILIQIKSMIENLNNINLLESIYNDIVIDINELKNRIINEISINLEIVFMPYKASMWDSMESIWKEANNDKDCLCHVVPIPYYEKNKEGKLTKFCYEGNEFPEYVDITNYNIYNFEKTNPDIIYIHNPYDDINTLTEVDNKYFSRNLSRHTDMLVYVPYYIDGSYSNKFEHSYGMVPGCQNADKIIAQSEEHKKLFTQIGYSELKVLNIGSPKFDKIIRIENENIDIPLEWRHKCKGKKVVLLNTTIDDVLNNHNWIKETINILNSFIEDDSIVLIWRAHPLIDITLNTMKSEYAHIYKQIVEQVKLCKNIILDDNADIYKAIKISDGLISGYSSIIFQYIITGKPVLSLINKERLSNDRIYCCNYRGAYSIESNMDVREFIKLVVEENDYKKQERVNMLKASITYAEGNNGKNIHDYIKNEIIEVKNLVENL